MDYLPEMVLNEWEKKYDLHTQHVNVSNNEDALKKIADGEIDVFVSLEDFRLGGYGMAALTDIGSSKIYFAIGTAVLLPEPPSSAMTAMASSGLSTFV